MAGDDPPTTPDFDIMEIQDDVERILRKCDVAILVPIATTLKAEQTTYADADKRRTLRGIQTVFNEVVDTTQKLAMFTSLKDVIPDELVAELEQALQKVYMTKPVNNTNSNTLENNEPLEKANNNNENNDDNTKDANLLQQQYEQLQQQKQLLQQQEIETSSEDVVINSGEDLKLHQQNIVAEDDESTHLDKQLALDNLAESFDILQAMVLSNDADRDILKGISTSRKRSRESSPPDKKCQLSINLVPPGTWG